MEILKTPGAADWNVFYQRGIAYERLKEWPKAEPNFRKALELNPDQPQVMNYLGYSWVDQGMNLHEAMDMIKKAVDMRPSDGYIVDRSAGPITSSASSRIPCARWSAPCR